MRNVNHIMKVMFLFYASHSCPPAFCAAVSSSGSGLEGDLFGMGIWSLGLGAVGAALAGIFLANTDLCLTKTASASLEYLDDADLRSTLDGRLVLLLHVYFSFACLYAKCVKLCTIFKVNLHEKIKPIRRVVNNSFLLCLQTTRSSKQRTCGRRMAP